MSIDVQQPRAYDLVSNNIQIAGVAGGAFEATFNYRVSEGHDEVTVRSWPATALVATDSSS